MNVREVYERNRSVVIRNLNPSSPPILNVAAPSEIPITFDPEAPPMAVDLAVFEFSVRELADLAIYGPRSVFRAVCGRKRGERDWTPLERLT